MSNICYGVHIRPFKYFSVLISIIAHASCMNMRDAHAHHDVTRFAYDANHVNMMSPAFAFHSCHIEMRRHDLNSVCIVGKNTMSSWFTSHGDVVGMTSLCSHYVCFALMMSSCLDHDIIVTHMDHDCSHGA